MRITRRTLKPLIEEFVNNNIRTNISSIQKEEDPIEIVGLEINKDPYDTLIENSGSDYLDTIIENRDNYEEDDFEEKITHFLLTITQFIIFKNKKFKKHIWDDDVVNYVIEVMDELFIGDFENYFYNNIDFDEYDHFLEWVQDDILEYCEQNDIEIEDLNDTDLQDFAGI